ncbi:nuclear transport factor 2 family protein [Novosphingobium colocasiae]|nr:hypothetical protein [Novosphingobium colocasiae]
MTDAERITRAFATAIEKLRFLDAFSLLDDDGKYHVIGTTPASGVYHGPQDVFDRLVPVLGGFKEPPAVKFEEPIIQGDRAVLLGSGTGLGPTGPYNQPYYAFVLKFADGKLMEMIEFMDTQMLVSAVFGEAEPA